MEILPCLNHEKQKELQLRQTKRVFIRTNLLNKKSTSAVFFNFCATLKPELSLSVMSDDLASMPT